VLAVLIVWDAVNLLTNAQAAIKLALLLIFTKTSVFRIVLQVLYLLEEYAPLVNRLVKLVTALLRFAFPVTHQQDEVYWWQELAWHLVRTVQLKIKTKLSVLDVLQVALGVITRTWRTVLHAIPDLFWLMVYARGLVHRDTLQVETDV